MENYYCSFCKKVWKLIAKAKGLRCCPDCLGDLILVKLNFKPDKITINEIKDKFSRKFTTEEIKSIFRSWRKSIERILTWYELYPELAKGAYSGGWKSQLKRMGCKIVN